VTSTTARQADRPTAIGHYSPGEVARLAGASPRRIGSWARYGIIPRVSRRPSVYSYADAGEAVVARYLVDQGVKPKKVREMVERLRDRYGEWPLARAPLEHEGGLVVIREGDKVLVDVVDRPEHLVEEGTFLALTDVREALGRGGWVALKHPRAHIQVDPQRLSGRPTIRDRRLPTTMVAELADRDEGRALLRTEFGLTEEEIEDAVDYEADVAEALAA
jgi:uncharacterized protein (DUF433 family)/DNA-binding transcriptional MerR regulator